MQPVIDELGALRRHQEEFEQSIDLVDPDAPVAHCGDWRVRDLVHHLAWIHRWAAGVAVQQPAERLPIEGFELRSGYAREAAGLREVFGVLDPDAITQTLLDDPAPAAAWRGTVRFWHRRQALETLVHLWDLRTSGGLDFDPGTEAWLDCLDEVVTVMHPRQLRLGRVSPPATRVRLVATDAPGDYVLAGSPDAPEVVVTGPIRQLALLSWGRLDLADPSLAITGRAAGLVDVLAAGLTP